MTTNHKYNGKSKSWVPWAKLKLRSTKVSYFNSQFKKFQLRSFEQINFLWDFKQVVTIDSF